MTKYKTILGLFIFYILFGISTVRPYAANDYLTYSEVMLSSGKLLKYATNEEYEYMLSMTEGTCFIGCIIYIENASVDGSYISNTLYSMDNTSHTAIEYTLEYSIETNNKVSLQTTGSLSGAISATYKKIKGEASAKCSVDYSETTTQSIKEKRTMKLTIEPNSRLIVYLTGDLTVSNGACSFYHWWIRIYEGAFEFVQLKSQFSKLEKRAI